MPDETRRIQSVDRSFQILRQISENGCSSISEISEDVGLSPGTVHTHLATLISNGFVQKEGEEYKLGMEFIPFSERVRSQTDLFRAGKKEIEKLAHKYDAAAHLITEYQGKTLILYETFGKDAIGKEVHTKKRDEPQVHTHCTAGGKAILAHLPESRVDQIIDQHGLPAYTSHTITEKDTLYQELEQIRDQRYAVNNEEVVHGNQGIGAPIIDEHESVIGAISISGPANSWRGKQLEDELARAVIRSANNIEINLHTETGLL